MTVLSGSILVTMDAMEASPPGFIFLWRISFKEEETGCKAATASAPFSRKNLEVTSCDMKSWWHCPRHQGSALQLHLLADVPVTTFQINLTYWNICLITFVFLFPLTFLLWLMSLRTPVSPHCSEEPNAIQCPKIMSYLHVIRLTSTFFFKQKGV